LQRPLCGTPGVGPHAVDGGPSRLSQGLIQGTFNLAVVHAIARHHRTWWVSASGNAGPLDTLTTAQHEA